MDQSAPEDRPGILDSESLMCQFTQEGLARDDRSVLQAAPQKLRRLLRCQSLHDHIGIIPTAVRRGATALGLNRGLKYSILQVGPTAAP